MRIWVKMIDNLSISKLIKEEEFNENTMVKFTKDELSSNKAIGISNLNDILKSNKAPGIVSNRRDSSKSSIWHNNKIDSGAVSETIDEGIENAKPRFEKNKYIQAVKNYRLKPKIV